ncbi:SRPBCC domain-containing protein [Leucobacter sp. M11]|uniref:SRPBCC domain-containing protein n=1 Tax=Leucobacter sp. M11 TaxID=2993565 RepID=UPI002D80ADD2|nr:SRPBCC domain-containing protein [Leucobacter sp. M11]MEB4613112.1 SRPBCC domain-containing protein [Leucobacter sp. M11]
MTDARTGALLRAENDTLLIRFDRALPHRAVRVWSALARPEHLGAWLPGSRIDAEPGGVARLALGEAGASEGQVLEAFAPSGRVDGLLMHSWAWDGLPNSVVSWSLAPGDGGTRLRLSHAEVSDPEAAVSFAAGWHLIADGLARFLRREPAAELWANAEPLLATYRAQLAAGSDGG